MSFEQEGIPITAAQRNVDFALNLATLSEQIRKGIHNREVLTHPSLPTRIELAALKGANRLLNPILELGIRRDGRIAVLPPATVEDAQGAVDALFGATRKTPEEFYRHYKLYVQKVPTRERDILLCTCAPRGAEAAGDLMFGKHKKSGLERVGEVVALEFTPELRKKLGYVTQERFLSPEVVANVYEKVSSERAQLTKDPNKPIVVFQGLHPSYAMRTVSPHNTSLLGTRHEHDTAKIVSVYEKLDPKILAHEFAHVFHDRESGKQSNLFFVEGDANVAVGEVGQSYDARIYQPAILQHLKWWTKRDGTERVIEILLGANAGRMRKNEPQDYDYLSVLGCYAAEQIIKTYGREFWNQFFITMNYNISNYEEFLFKDDAEFTHNNVTMTYMEFRSMLAKRLKELV